MVTHKATIHKPVEHEPQHSGYEFTIPEIPFDAVVEVMRMGAQLGIGLVAMAWDGAQKIALDAIDRGAKIEKSGMKSFSHFEKVQVTHMKDYLKKVQGGVSNSVQKVENIEAHVEEALKTHDVPTRDDIRDLKHQIAELGKKIASTKVAPRGRHA